MEKGYIQIYTGDGKGKTTAALGLALRAAGNGLNVFIAQFMKGQDYGELHSVKNIPQITIRQFGKPTFIHVDQATKEDIRMAQEGLAASRDAMKSGKYDIIILDEIFVTLYFRLLSEEDVLKFIAEKPESMELILTGRKASQQFIDLADLVTEMKEVKHYYQQGVMARPGIES